METPENKKLCLLYIYFVALQHNQVKSHYKIDHTKYSHCRYVVVKN